VCHKPPAGARGGCFFVTACNYSTAAKKLAPGLLWASAEPLITGGFSNRCGFDKPRRGQPPRRTSLGAHSRPIGALFWPIHAEKPLQIGGYLAHPRLQSQDVRWEGAFLLDRCSNWRCRSSFASSGLLYFPVCHYLEILLRYCRGIQSFWAPTRYEKFASSLVVTFAAWPFDFAFAAGGWRQPPIAV